MDLVCAAGRERDLLHDGGDIRIFLLDVRCRRSRVVGRAARGRRLRQHVLLHIKTDRTGEARVLHGHVLGRGRRRHLGGGLRRHAGPQRAVQVALAHALAAISARQVSLHPR